MMAVQDIYKVYREMERDHIILSFKGVVTRELLESLCQIMEAKMILLNEDVQRRKKVYNILVESLQNIYHHLDELMPDADANDLPSNDAVFMVTREEAGSYAVCTGNYILDSKSVLLKSNIEHINSLSTDELRSHYVDKLNTSEFSEKGGAGLGMIDLARKSGNKLGFSFTKVSDKYSFFSLQIKIS